jgi:serine phosphatase RsbU (regulator of sigma subunit)
VRRVIEHAELQRQNREYRKHLENLNRELRQTLKYLEQDEKAGRRIQFQLLPEDNRTFGGYTFRRRLYPSTYLSGDFVDYFPIDDRHVGFYMADVSGHGAASAFVTVMLNTLVIQYRDALYLAGDDTVLHPQLTLQRLNRDICRQSLDKHLTIFYGVIDLEEDTLHYSNAGQFPYPVLHDACGARTLECPGRPIGLFDEVAFTARQCELPPHGDLLLVSDGILELMPEAALLERLNELLPTMEAMDLDGLAEELGVLPDRQLPDDIALLAFSRGRGNG